MSKLSNATNAGMVDENDILISSLPYIKLKKKIDDSNSKNLADLDMRGQFR